MHYMFAKHNTWLFVKGSLINFNKKCLIKMLIIVFSVSYPQKLRKYYPIHLCLAVVKLANGLFTFEIYHFYCSFQLAKKVVFESTHDNLKEKNSLRGVTQGLSGTWSNNLYPEICHFFLKFCPWMGRLFAHEIMQAP